MFCLSGKFQDSKLYFALQVLGIGKDVPAASYAAASVIAAAIGGYSTAQVCERKAVNT